MGNFIFFGVNRNTVKRKRNELTTAILIKLSATFAFVGKDDNTTLSPLKDCLKSYKIKERIALKSNSLRAKAVRYELCKDFFS